MEELRKQVRRVQWWLGVQRFVASVGWCCFGTLTIALALIAIDKYKPLGVQAWVWAASGVALGIAAAFVWAILGRRSALEAAIELDRRLGLKERVSSTLAMSPEEQQTDAGQALLADAVRRVERIDVAARFPIKPGRQILLPAVPAALAALAALFLQPAPLDNPAEAEVIKKQIELSSQTLQRKLQQQRRRAQQEGLKEAQHLLRRLEEETKELAIKEEDRKQAMIKLNDLAQQLENRQKQLGGAEQVRKQLSQLKDMGKGPAEKLLSALARGDTKRAMQELQKLKDELANQRLDHKQREELAKQLDQLRQRLQKVVDDHREAEKDLKKRIEQARRSGQSDQATRLEEQLDRLRQKAADMDRLEQLAQKFGQCSKSLKAGQTGDAGQMLAELEKDLKEIQEQVDEFEMLEDAKNELAKARNQIACEGCRGSGCELCQGEPQDGLGRGRGYGFRPEEKDDTEFFDTRAAVKTGRGAASIVGEVDGPNVKGDYQQELNQQFQAARQQTTDPLTNQRIPRKQRQHAKEYFDRLREGK